MGTSVSLNQYHSGPGYGLSENNKQDGGWGTSLTAGAFGPKPYGSSTMMTCPFTPCRLVFKGMSVSRPNAVVGKCRMIRHSRDKKNEPNPQRCVLCPLTFLPSFSFQMGEATGMRLCRVTCCEGEGGFCPRDWWRRWACDEGLMFHAFFLRFLFWHQPFAYFFLVGLIELHIQRRPCCRTV